MTGGRVVVADAVDNERLNPCGCIEAASRVRRQCGDADRAILDARGVAIERVSARGRVGVAFGIAIKCTRPVSRIVAASSIDIERLIADGGVLEAGSVAK